MTDLQSWVYLIGNPSATPLAKIGVTTNLTSRVAGIRTLSPIALELLWSAPGDSVSELTLHREFKDRRHHGEWFDFADTDAVAEVKDAMKRLGLDRRDPKRFRRWGESAPAFIDFGDDIPPGLASWGATHGGN